MSKNFFRSIDKFFHYTNSVAIIPLIPLVFEHIVYHRIELSTICLAAGMYPITIGVWSDSKAILSLTIALSILGSMCFGLISLINISELVKNPNLISTDTIFVANFLIIIVTLLCFLIENIGKTTLYILSEKE